MRWRWIVITTSIFLAGAVIYVLTAQPTYIATTQLYISPQLNSSEAQKAFAEDAFLEAQLEIARSNDVFGATAKSLDLVNDPDFARSAPSLLDIGKDWLARSLTVDRDSRGTTGPASGATDKSDRAIARLQNNVAMRQIGRSMILEISASASTARKAVAIADTVAREYIRKNVLMKAQAAHQYSDWLEKFLVEQQRGLTDAANDLADFKSSPRDQFKLVQLQSAAAARRALYENTLTQYSEAKQRISDPVSDATIVSPATSPLSKARPRSALIIGFAAVLGASAGAMLGMIRHAGDRRIIRVQRFADAAGLPFVTSLAKSGKTRKGRPGGPVAAEADSGSAITYPFIPGMAELSATMVGLRRKRKVVVIGIVGVNRGGGASTIACELAFLCAKSGSRTLLIDAAADKSSLSGSIAPHSTIGLSDVLEDAHLLHDAMLAVTPTLRFLPLGTVQGVTPAIRLSSNRTQLNFDSLKKVFDAVFVDISPLSQSPDANAIAPVLDGVLVVAWHGRTSIDEAVRAIDSLRNVGAEVLGAVINKAPLRMQS
jgi:Mrp family chromosome partitioning ATPase